MVVLEICVASLEAADTADGPTAPSCTPGQSCPLSFPQPVALRPFRENHPRQEDDDRSGMATMERMGLIETTQVRPCYWPKSRFSAAMAGLRKAGGRLVACGQ